MAVILFFDYFQLFFQSLLCSTYNYRIVCLVLFAPFDLDKFEVSQFVRRQYTSAVVTFYSRYFKLVEPIDLPSNTDGMTKL